MFIYSRTANASKSREWMRTGRDMQWTRCTRPQTGDARISRVFRFPFYSALSLFIFLSNHLGQNSSEFFYPYYVFMQRLPHSYANKNGIILRNSYIIYLIGRRREGSLRIFFDDRSMLQFLKTLVRLTPRRRLISVRYIEIEAPYALTGTILNVIDSFE